MARAYPTPDFQKYDFMRFKGLTRARYGRVSYAVILYLLCVMVLVSNIYIAGVTLCLFKSARMLVVLGANSSCNLEKLSTSRAP